MELAGDSFSRCLLFGEPRLKLPRALPQPEGKKQQ
jgi:hypothetical protein